jgi:hypothetical protein
VFRSLPALWCRLGEWDNSLGCYLVLPFLLVLGMFVFVDCRFEMFIYAHVLILMLRIQAQPRGDGDAMTSPSTTIKRETDKQRIRGNVFNDDMVTKLDFEESARKSKSTSTFPGLSHSQGLVHLCLLNMVILFILSFIFVDRHCVARTR